MAAFRVYCVWLSEVRMPLVLTTWCLSELALCLLFTWVPSDEGYHFGPRLLSRPLQWRHDERDGVSNHHFHYLLNLLFRRRSKKTSKLRVTGLCEGNPPVTDGFPSQRTSNEENVSIWWRHHAVCLSVLASVRPPVWPWTPALSRSAVRFICLIHIWSSHWPPLWTWILNDIDWLLIENQSSFTG